MAVGRISTRVLTDIANAVRAQNGGTTLYKPAELAAAVEALDGTKTGDALAAAYPEVAEGLVAEGVFTGIADAIRRQNGSDTRYKPGEMAAAILAFSWKMVAKPRAMLFADGYLEMNCVDAVPDGHGAAVGVWDLALDGYSAASARPWHSVRADVLEAYLAPSLGTVTITSAAYWFADMTSLERLQGFEMLAGVSDLTRLCSGCSTIYEVLCSVSDLSGVTKADGIFDGCNRLVGAKGYVPTASDGIGCLNFGDKGALSSGGPTDMRVWVWGALFDDGEVVIQTEKPTAGSRKIVAMSQICAEARYRAIRAMPWGEYRDQVKMVTFEKIMMFDETIWNLNYWFYGCLNLEYASGFDALKRIGEMEHTFNGCTGLCGVNLCGVVPDHLTSLFYTFAGCTSLASIMIDKTWSLPEGIDWTRVPGSQTFMGCTSLIGGAGHHLADGTEAGVYLRPDTADVVGYCLGV